MSVFLAFLAALTPPIVTDDDLRRSAQSREQSRRIIRRIDESIARDEKIRAELMKTIQAAERDVLKASAVVEQSRNDGFLGCWFCGPFDD